MPIRRFIQTDVFSSDPTLGNGLAVVVDGDDLTTEQMQAFAAWTNLAETTFLLPPTDPDADYRVRIFTTRREMHFAGHPTLGSCMAWLHAGNVPKKPEVVRQECAIGIVDIDLSGPTPAFVSPPTEVSAMSEAEQTRLITAMGINRSMVKSAIVLDNGPVWNLFELNSAADVLAVDATRVVWPEHQGLALFGAYPEGSECQFETRNIAPSSGMVEDPITGSLNAAIACWLLQTNRLPDAAVAAQGTNLGRTGRVFYRQSPNYPGKVLIGGAVNVLIDGTLDL
ncbi:PhzF family phenazine biosynthesis protein [Shimia isoporae]|uniref:PhzF family phenazine biosynthesis protein n=1 Tax=Shimia isoporae TaxID=647720 RepID=A0A4R1NIK9_9RHOB|nr:PhzF family phenazine biosynthesis protein [Shimia isoporae]TCL08057.1 PhzF family phenazine biosynthesis protein [Shimia isoporae]